MNGTTTAVTGKRRQTVSISYLGLFAKAYYMVMHCRRHSAHPHVVSAAGLQFTLLLTLVSMQTNRCLCGHL